MPAKSKKTASKSDRPTAAEFKRNVLKLDREILALIKKRSDEFRGYGKDGCQALNLSSLLAKYKGDVAEESVKAIFREIQSSCQALIQEDRAAYLGPEFSYSHLAAIEHLGQSCELIPASTIAAVFDAVVNNDVEFGIVPIENSTDGRIVDTLETFVSQSVKICGEIPIRIHHYLLGKCRRSEITEIQSKPQAISQCRGWLAKNVPNAKIVAASSTTAAAKNAATMKGVAAIASRQAGINYELKEIAAEIEDNKENTTRFAVIGKEVADRTGNDKTSLMFELNHEPGALADAMTIFKRNRLNLTWIESIPKKGSKNEYIFFVELEGHQSDLRVRRALESLEKKVKLCRVLGSYPRSRL